MENARVIGEPSLNGRVVDDPHRKAVKRRRNFAKFRNFSLSLSSLPKFSPTDIPLESSDFARR